MNREPGAASLPRYEMSIAGKAIGSAEWLPVIDPATETAWAEVPRASEPHLERAVAAARSAFASWSRLSLAERRRAIARWLDALEQRGDEFVRVLHHERGGPDKAGRGELRGALAFSRQLLELYPSSVPLEQRADFSIERRRCPWGVVAAITPWNFPLQLALVKIVPALLAGNAVIVKPSPLAPVSALLLGALARAELPPGLINVLSGGEELGPLVTAHAGIDKISFTGSIATGRRVLEATAATLKRVTLELGGNDAAIVAADADPLQAADAIGWLAFANNGQICLAVKRVYVHDSVYDAFCERVAAVADGCRVGPAADDSVDNGPLQNVAQYQRVKALLADAIEHGGRAIAGGTVPIQPGYFLRPTVVADASDDMRLVYEEQFGPVLPVLRFTDLDDALRRANASEYGLGSSLWSGDAQNAAAAGRQLAAGVTWFNQHGFPDPRMPLAGAGQSGIGVEFGCPGVAEYTRLQIINIATAVGQWFAPGDRDLDADGAAAGQAFLDRTSAAARVAADTISVIDPATETVFATCAATSQEELDAALARAHAAAFAWRERSIEERCQLLREAAEGLLTRREELAWLLVREQGKPLFRARGETGLAAMFMQSIAEQAPKALAPEDIELCNGEHAQLAYEPLGVTAAIAPWNAPLALGLVKVATALAAGNTVVLKPSPYTPLATLRAAELLQERLPSSVLEVVSGGAELGAALVDHVRVRKVSFTGSTATGKHILRATAAQLKRLTLELGGNDAAIILDDADPVAVASSVAATVFGNSGQFCAAIKRIYVARSIFESFTGALVAEAKSLHVGPGLDPESDLGPVQNAAQFERICQLLAGAQAAGGRVLCGGPRAGAGYFIDPAVVTGVTDGCALVDEEQFGPLVPVMPIDSVQEGVARANDTAFGLGASVWSGDLDRARAAAEGLNAGTVWINQHGRFDATVPMPMIGDSGLGTDYAEFGLREQTQLHVYVGQSRGP